MRAVSTFVGIVSIPATIILICLFATLAIADGYPHFFQNNIECDSCHYVYGTEPQLLPPWTHRDPVDDDTQFNSLCWSCHNGLDAVRVMTHSSSQADDDYGSWTVECIVCHEPHFHEQAQTYTSAGYLYEDASTGVTLTTIIRSGAGWTPDAFAGLVVFPDTSQPMVSYMITSNTSDTITVHIPMDLGIVGVGDTFAISSGKLVKSSIDIAEITDPLNPKSGIMTVKLFNRTGPNSFADGDATYDGICEICHTETIHFKNDGLGSDQLHSNVGGGIEGTNCTKICHQHYNGFIHGGNNSSNCAACHNTGSHVTHVPNQSLIGPAVFCDSCHDVNNMPYFKSGTDNITIDGNIDLAETDVCDSCHSKSGAFDGLDDADIGARYGSGGVVGYNWDNGVYTGAALKAGYEQWCVTCHDLGTSIVKGRQAPDVAGDNTNYGYYVSGHGRAGATEECGACHGLDMNHNFDGQKTYYGEGTGDVFTQDPLRSYKLGFRLKDVGGMDPLQIPKLDSVYSADAFKLCYSCHDEETLISDTKSHGCYGNTSNPYKNAAAITTQFRNMHKEGHDTGDNDLPANFHADHLIDANGFGSNWYSNGPGTFTGKSRTSCTTCHNPHGDKRSDNSATIAMTIGAFEMVRGSDAFGQYGEVTSLAPYDQDPSNDPNRRCANTCHGFGGNTSAKWYYISTIPNSITLSDNNSSDPARADAGFTNNTEISVRPYSLFFTPTEIMCAEDNAFTVNATPWGPYATPYTYTLLPGDGLRTVYCMTRNASETSAVQSATITLDTVPPVNVFNTTLTSPNGSEVFAQGSSQDITWNDGDFSADTTLKANPVTLDYSIDSGVSFPDSIDTDLGVASPYNWTLPVIDQTTVRVRLTVTDKAGNQASDSSDADFTIQ